MKSIEKPARTENLAEKAPFSEPRTPQYHKPPIKCCTIASLLGPLSGRSTRSYMTWCLERRTLLRPSPPRASLSSAQRKMNWGQFRRRSDLRSNKCQRDTREQLPTIRKLSRIKMNKFDTDWPSKKQLFMQHAPLIALPYSLPRTLAGWRVINICREIRIHPNQNAKMTCMTWQMEKNK